jgi:hypothetical protein
MNNTTTALDEVVVLAHTAPTHERALIKQVPIQELEMVKTYYRERGVPIRIRYRGKRHDRGMRLTTLKRDAERFSVYPV